MSTNQINIWKQFFDYLFGVKEGWLNIALAKPEGRFKQRFFQWPEQKVVTAHFIESEMGSNNMWYAVSLFAHAERKREFAIANNLVWADLDYVDPEFIDPRPAIAIKTSDGRYQAIWRLEQDVSWQIAQEYSRRIAYNVGADKSGWDATQLLRVPFTFNFKYESEDKVPPVVDVLWVEDTLTPTSAFDTIPLGEADEIDVDIDVNEPLPDMSNILSFEDILTKHKSVFRRNEILVKLIYDMPTEDDDWSSRLWRLINIAFELGIEREEVFVIANNAKCNKYERDRRPLSHLWREVLRAEINQKEIHVILGVKPFEMPNLVEQQEADHEFLTQYKTWAAKITDAPTEYHELGFFIMLSAVLSDLISVKTSFAPEGMGLNLWGLVLGTSTLTRKTTAMNLVKDILLRLDGEYVIASDASPEGLLTAVRSRQVSIFFRDEISSFFKGVNTHKYMSSMPEILTNLYDVPEVYIRQLAKTTVKIEKPYLIVFGGGIRDAVFAELSHEYVLSGFIPRFLVVSATHDKDRLRPVGPPAPYALEDRQAIIDRLADLRDRHVRSALIRDTKGRVLSSLQPQMDAKLSEEAWERFNDIQARLVRAAEDSNYNTIAQPTFQRLAYSTLKMATLLAASRDESGDPNTVWVQGVDLVNAASYTQRWGRHTVDMILNTGKTVAEKKLDKVYSDIALHPGVLRSELMQRHSLHAKEATELFTTLLERGLVESKKKGKATHFYPFMYRKEPDDG
jgi:Protein of unknown function (DUF3987)/RepB DNA-primase N-terminal domain